MLLPVEPIARILSKIRAIDETYAKHGLIEIDRRVRLRLSKMC